MVPHESDEENDPAIDEMDEEERARLYLALDEAIASVKAGNYVDGDEVLRRLLNRSEAK